jgi:chromatin segregation and condensation protein Rec8/ScpA/Scc1 (kleisin family)
MTENNNRVSQKDLYDAINELRREVRGEFAELKKNYVTHSEFYGMETKVKDISNALKGGATVVLLAVLGAILKLVIA